MGAVFESLRNPDGSVNKEAIHSLQRDELKVWIERRLSGDDPYLPLGRSEELPHTLVLQLFQAQDPTHPFRERLHQATLELLEPVLAGRTAPPSPEWLGEALYLAHSIRSQIPRALLRRAFESERFSTESYGEVRIDIHLLDLLAIQDNHEPVDFWLGLIRHPRYARSALIALERYGQDAIVKALPDYIATMRSTTESNRLESRLALPLKRIVERFGGEELRPLLKRRLAYPDQLTIERALDMVGIPLVLAREPIGQAEVVGAPLPPWSAVATPTPEDVHKRLSEAPQGYSSWLEEKVHWLDVGKIPEKFSRILVLDVTLKGRGGHWCASVLASHGAEVIVIAPPQQSSSGITTSLSRKEATSEETVMGEAIGGGSLNEARSMYFITLNLEMSDGRDIFNELVRRADVLVEDYPPGNFDAWGIGYRELSLLNSRLVHGRIGWHGQSELPDNRPWVWEYSAGVSLAMRLMVALIYRDMFSGRGQYVEVIGGSDRAAQEVAHGGVTFVDEVGEFPHFRYRGHAAQIDDVMYGKVLYGPPSQSTQEAPPRLKWIGRPIGYDNEEIYRKIFAFKKDDIDGLKKRGII